MATPMLLNFTSMESFPVFIQNFGKRNTKGIKDWKIMPVVIQKRRCYHRFKLRESFFPQFNQDKFKQLKDIKE